MDWFGSTIALLANDSTEKARMGNHHAPRWKCGHGDSACGWCRIGPLEVSPWRVISPTLGIVVFAFSAIAFALVFYWTLEWYLNRPDELRKKIPSITTSALSN